MKIIRLLLALSLLALVACDSSSIAISPGPQVTVQADQAEPPTDTTSAAGDVSGLWFCATTAMINGEYTALWNDAYKLEFKADRTLVNPDNSAMAGTWWYTAAGVVVQWSNGDTTEYLPNVDNLGGIATGTSHCLREPPARPNGTDDLTLPTYDCGNGAVYSFGAAGELTQDGKSVGQWLTYLGNGIGTPTPDAEIGFTYVEFNETRFTVIEDTLLQEFGEWSCFSVDPDGPLLQLIAPVP